MNIKYIPLQSTTTKTTTLKTTQSSSSITTKMESSILTKTTSVMVVLVPLFTLITTYSIYYGTGLNKETDTIVPYVSDTIDYAPGANIGTLGLGVTVILLSILYLLKYKYGELRLTSLSSSTISIGYYERFNLANLVIGLVSTFCLLGVISFQYHLVPDAHDSFAAIFFFLGVIYTITQTIFDWKLSINSRKVRIYRSVVAVFNVLFVVASQGTNYIDGLAYQTVSATTEILNVIIFFLYFASYYIEINSSVIVFELKDREPLLPSDDDKQ